MMCSYSLSIDIYSSKLCYWKTCHDRIYVIEFVFYYATGKPDYICVIWVSGLYSYYKTWNDYICVIWVPGLYCY